MFARRSGLFEDEHRAHLSTISFPPRVERVLIERPGLSGIVELEFEDVLSRTPVGDFARPLARVVRGTCDSSSDGSLSALTKSDLNFLAVEALAFDDI